MEKETRNRLIPIEKLEDVPELIHIIQSLLPVKDAACTCVLSKIWLHAWSTIPTLRFLESIWISSEQETNFMNYIDKTLLRYHRDSIPIESIFLEINIKNQYLASLAENWIRSLSSKTSLKELYLKIWNGVSSFTLTDEIFSGENLDIISVRIDSSMINSLWINMNPLINCVSLRELELIGVNISEEVLQKLLTTCTLLEKLNILFHKGLKTIKVKKLHCLRELKISSQGENDILEIEDVPSLRLLFYDSSFEQRLKPLPFNMGSLGNVMELYLDGVKIDGAFFDKINSSCPFLECLTLKMGFYSLETLDITCVSLKRLTLG